MVGRGCWNARLGESSSARAVRHASPRPRCAATRTSATGPPRRPGYRRRRTCTPNADGGTSRSRGRRSTGRPAISSIVHPRRTALRAHRPTRWRRPRRASEPVSRHHGRRHRHPLVCRREYPSTSRRMTCRSRHRSGPARASPTAWSRSGVDASANHGPLARPWRPMIGSEHLALLLQGAGPGGRDVGGELIEALRIAGRELGASAVRAYAILHPLARRVSPRRRPDRPRFLEDRRHPGSGPRGRSPADRRAVLHA